MDPSRPDRTHPMARPRTSRHAARRLFAAVGWLALAVLTWVVVSIVTGDTRVVQFTVLAQSLAPWIFLPVWVAAIVALIRRRWLPGGACLVLVVAQVLLVAPAIGSDRLPRWAGNAPTITVQSVNVWDQNPRPNRAAHELVESKADVLVLVEVAGYMQRALHRAGIDHRFPHQLQAVSSKTGTNDGIYSRIPLTHETLIHDALNELPAATVTRGGRSLRIVAVHIDGPLHGRAQWQSELARLRPVASRYRGPLAIVGDFNATRWNPPFRDLLAVPLTDAHESRGLGLTRSWPVRGTAFAAFGPLMRLDHALTNRDAAATRVRDVEISGSDHVGFIVTVAMKRA
ncbi:MAG: endonuclease/exonuclease/phosphatase family protein [Acidimicrobiia bacterium]